MTRELKYLLVFLTDTQIEPIADDGKRRRVNGCSSRIGVFRGNWLGVFFLLASPGLMTAGAARFDLRPATIQGFNAYLEKTETRNTESLKRGPFLWVDGLQADGRTQAFARLKNGEVLSRRLSAKSDSGNIGVPSGLIHDWEGIVFIPGANIEDVLKILQDYDHQAKYYAPDVEQSRLESRNGDTFRFFLRFRRRKIVTVVLNTEHQVTYYRDSPLRAHSRSTALRIAQVEDPGSIREKEKNAGEDDGFLWRMETWWRFEERDGGVYVQNQVVTLTRDIPTGLAWLIDPFIEDIPKETLEFTLQATRKAVLNSRTN